MRHSSPAVSLCAPSAPHAGSDHSALTRWERGGLWLLLGVIIVFGGIVEMRSAFLHRRLTDLTVYLRAAWAVRAGEALYDIKDDNGFYYQYPPLLAILLVPLADPPAGVACRAVPFAVTVAIWYVFSIACLVFALHQLARCLDVAEDGQPSDRSQSRHAARRWWCARVVPLLACLVPIGQSLARSQVSMLLLAILGCMTAAMVRRHNFRAGLWLAGAICLKVIPAFLLLIPLWQRNVRCLLGCAFGLFVGLGVIPAAVFGLPRTIQYYQEYDLKVLRAGVGHSTDQSRAQTLTEITSTDSQSLVALFHNTIHLDRAFRPHNATPAIKRAHWIVGGLLTLVTLGAAGLRPLRSAPVLVLFVGAIIFNMLLISPVSHLHYYCLSVPLVCGLMAVSWKRSGTLTLGKPLLVLLALNVVTAIVPALPGLEVTRDLCLATYGQLPLWLLACRKLWRERRAEPVATSIPHEMNMAA